MRHRALLAASGGVWTPANLSPLVWFDASDAASITSSGGAVSAWASQVGAYSAVQDAAAGKPTTGSTTINGLNVLAFDGGDVLSCAAVDLSAADAVTVWVVGTVSGAGDRIFAEHSPNFNSNVGWIIYSASTRQVVYGHHRTAVSSYATTATISTTAKLMVGVGDMTLATSEALAYVDNTLSGSTVLNGNNATPFASQTLFIGARLSGVTAVAGLIGNIAEIGVVGRVITSDERAALRTYSQTKWGTA